MYVLRTIAKWGWCPALITALAVVGSILEWETWLIILVLGITLIAGVVVAVSDAGDREVRLSFLRLWHLASYFTRRFTSDSSLSIFAIIDSLFKIDNPKLWDWAQACEASRRVFNSWCNSFISRMESDVGSGRAGTRLPIYLNELWLLNNHYHELIEQFYEVAEKFEIPQEATEHYNRFAVEYNAFVQEFRENISKLKKVAETAIEPPSVKFAQELPVAP